MAEKKKDTNKDTKAVTGKLQIAVLILQILKALFDLRWIALFIVLAAIPIAPYLLISQADASTSACTYLGPRGTWQPGWASHCPAVALRRQFYDQ